MQKRSTELPKNACAENATPVEETCRRRANAIPAVETL